MADTNGWKPPENIKMVQQKGTIRISNNSSLFDSTVRKNLDSLTLTVTSPNGNLQRFSSKKITYTVEEEEFIVSLNQSGEYKLAFELKWHEMKSTGNLWLPDKYYNATATTYIYVNPESSAEFKPYSLGDTIRRLLDLTPTRTTNEQNKYTFDPIQLAEYDQEESPEFAFTGHTLFEALLIIAQYKGAFPVLRDGVISFRKLWSGKRYSESELPLPIDEISCSDINQYCTYLDTEVQNLVGINESQSGALVEPYAGGYKTTRAVSGSEISQDTAVISTGYNIYQHIKQEIGYIGSNLPTNNDLTEYVYESGDYFALTDKFAAYPASKAYALQWQQMNKNITELAHRTESVSSIAKAFTYPAIANIIQAKTGESYTPADSNFISYIISSIDKINDKGEHTLGDNSFADLMFRTTYIPVFNARIKQYKEYFGDFHHDGSLKYNQTAELVDSELYGEHLKQLIRKLGNATKRKIYIFNKIDDVPKVGDLIGNYSVYDVQMSIREDKVIATISFVKYAELSQYIGVKNPWKDSDVSTDKCYIRQINYNEFLLFTHDKTKTPTSSTIRLSSALPDKFSYPLTCVEGTGYTKEGAKLNTVLLPVVSLAMGNSIMFHWQYQNNYSAGYMSEAAPEGATDIISGTRYNRAQKAVKYADMYGKLETYEFSIMRSGPCFENTEGIRPVWCENVGTSSSVKLRDYDKDVNLEYDDGSFIVQLDSPFYYDIKLSLNCKRIENDNEVTVTETIVIHAFQTYVNMLAVYDDYTSIAIASKKYYGYDIANAVIYTDRAEVMKRIGYSLPLKASEIRTSSLDAWQGSKFIEVSKLLIEKNSSEALTFSVQYHYCTDNENFIIGSGLTNFCPLIGGKAEDLVLYGFNERINIFNRRISVNGATRLALPNIQNENGKVSIGLPADINNYQAWAYVGKDKNGNYQIIFGENKDLNGSAFNTELYLLPMHKLEDFV